MGKVLHKVFKTVVNNISQELPPLGESGLEVSHFIPEPGNFAEVTKLSDDIMKEFNQQSEFSSWRSRERWACDFIHGWLQR